METGTDRNRHKSEVSSFLNKNIGNQMWKIGLPPHGTGQETYFVRGSKHSYFVKLGAETERYLVMSELGLSPQVVAVGQLEDGMSILVQSQVSGSKPMRKDFHQYWMKFAESIRITHESEELKRILPKRSSDWHKDVGKEILEEIENRWVQYRASVPATAEYVENSIQYLKGQVAKFSESGLVASHNDVCNGNWLVTTAGTIYLLDYESMSLDDPALDLGAILWWYYPPEMRDEFLRAAGYTNDEEFRNRMRIRMAIHNLNIVIPRKDSFDRFEVEVFDTELEDFRAVMDGRENPQGYDD
jgi:thiamine kinase-like enzyme